MSTLNKVSTFKLNNAINSSPMTLQVGPELNEEIIAINKQNKLPECIQIRNEIAA